jgi:hypothetical protein
MTVARVDGIDIRATVGDSNPGPLRRQCVGLSSSIVRYIRRFSLSA